MDGPSRQIARYVDRIADTYFTNLDAKLIYRLDRFGRGGHHRPFNDAGFAGVRLMETWEHYDRQHQNLRTENGRVYGARDNRKVWAFRNKLKTEVAWPWGAVENVVWEGHDAAVQLNVEGPDGGQNARIFEALAVRGFAVVPFGGGCGHVVRRATA